MIRPIVKILLLFATGESLAAPPICQEDDHASVGAIDIGD